VVTVQALARAQTEEAIQRLVCIMREGPYTAQARPRNSSVPSCRPTQCERALAQDQEDQAAAADGRGRWRAAAGRC
jgi:hypothetical protein